MNKIIFAVMVASVVLMTGCATQEQRQNIAFNSTPSQASIYMNGSRIGETPASIPMNAEQSAMIEIRKDGYRTIPVMVSSNVDDDGHMASSAATVLVTTLVTWVAFPTATLPAFIGALLGAAMGPRPHILTPEKVAVTLEKVEADAVSAAQ